MYILKKEKTPQDSTSIVDKLKVDREYSEVYPNVTFTMPRGANLELKGEPGTKIEELLVDGDGSMKSRQGMLNNMVVGSSFVFPDPGYALC